jgi:hypothetical protein
MLPLASTGAVGAVAVQPLAVARMELLYHDCQCFFGLGETALSHSLCDMREEAMKLVKLASFRAPLGSSLLLLLAACADQRVAPPSVSVPEAVDLGGSSRVPHVAGRAGEGEGYGTAAPASTDHASMPGMSREATTPKAQTSAPGTDHSAAGHGSTRP